MNAPIPKTKSGFKISNSFNDILLINDCDPNNSNDAGKRTLPDKFLHDANALSLIIFIVSGKTNDVIPSQDANVSCPIVKTPVGISKSPNRD